MVSSPKIRHSKPRRDPVTIDLDAEPTKDEARGPVAEAKAAGADTAASNPLLDETPSTPPEPEPMADTPAPEAASADFREPPGREPADIAPPPRSEKRGGVSAIAAGLIGAVIALAGAGALQVAGILPAPGNPQAGAEIEALRGEIAAMRQEAASGPSTEGLSQRVDQLATSLDGALSQFEAARADQPAGVDTAALDERFKALDDRIAALAEQSGPADLSPVTGRLDALESTVEEVRQAASGVTALDQRLSALEGRLTELGGKVAEQAEQPGAALAIAASSLKAAIDRGEAFMTELETYAAVAPQSAEIEPLRAMAASGVPSRSALENAFPAAANAMIAAATPADPDAGFLDRLMSSAQSLVQVRPVGVVEGEGAPAIVARMEAALAGGDYASVVGEYEALPPASKEAGAEFIAKVKARQAADGLVDSIVATALKA